MRRRWKSWLLLAAPYLLCALLPVISVLFLEKTVLTNYQETMVADQQSSLQSAFNGMLQKIDSVENLSSMLCTSELVERYAYACINGLGHRTIDRMSLQKQFSGAKTNSLIYDVYLYDPVDNFVVSAQSAVSSREVFHRFTYAVEDLTLEQRVNRLADLPRKNRYTPAFKLRLPGEDLYEKELLEYRLFLPVGFVRENQTQLVVAMDAGELFREFRSDLGSLDEFYVYDDTGSLVYSVGTRYAELLPGSQSISLHAIETEDGALYGTVLRSQDGKWTVKVYLPSLMGNHGMSVLSPAFILFVILPMLCCVLLTIVFTHKNYRRILELANLFRSHTHEHPQEPEIVDYRLVQQYAGQVIEEKNRVTLQMSEYADSRKYEVLDKLIRDTYRTPEEALRMLKDTDLRIRPENNLVLCIRFAEQPEDPTGMSAVSDQLRRLLAQYPDLPFELMDTSAQETVCIVSLPDSGYSESTVQDAVSVLMTQLQGGDQTNVLIGAGNPAGRLEQLSQAYEQAKAVIRYRELSGNRVISYSDLAALEDLYFFPKEFDRQIMEYAAAGSAAEAVALIEEVYEENYVKNGTMLSLWAIDAIKARLWNCILSIAEKHDLSPEVLDPAESSQTLRLIRSETNPKRYFGLICEKVTLLTEALQAKKMSKPNRLANLIMEYVQANFCRQELSLKQISQALSIHENYISSLFKAAYGESLFSYVEKLRIEKACALMDGSQMKIEEIALTVGYTAAGTFRRAFKKHKGVSPAEYRNNASN